MLWFTSDLHLGHRAVLNFCARPWESIAAMNAALVDAINERVGVRDELYVLGDFSFRIGVEAARELREAIFCRNVHLVPGNHDRSWDVPDRAGTFIVEPPIVQLKLPGGRKLVLSHYPMMDWPSLGHGAIHLHGHIHATREYNERNRALGLLRYDVGVDANGYVPVSADDVLAFFEGMEHRKRSDWKDWPEIELREERG